MIGTLRAWILALAWVSVALGYAPTSSFAAPPDADKPTPEASTPDRDRSALFGLPDEDPPALFVPKTPRTVETRREIEAVRDYSAARALEDHRSWNEAIELLEKALKTEPDSVAILKRLSRLCFMRGKVEEALQYSRKVLDSDPGDTDTISRLVTHYNRKGDHASVETILKGVLANPRLARHSPGDILAEFELGKLYADRLQRDDKAAEAYAQVLESLDEKTANRLSPVDQMRILGDDPAEAYLEFGKVFLKANKYDLAIKAFRHGLVYDDEHSLLSLSLAEALLGAGQGDRALEIVDAYLKRQPQGSEAYELIEKILTSLHREAEITPRLEQAAKTDASNLSLQYALADRYHKIGQVDRAEAIYKSLLAAHPNPEGYAALAASLLKRRKADELLKVFVEALSKPSGYEAVKKQLEAVVKDSALADGVLDAGLKMLSAEPPQIPGSSVQILAAIAKDTGKSEKLVPILRVLLKQNPSPQIYREIAHSLGDEMHKYDEAAATVNEMLTRFPDERNVRTLISLGEYYHRAGQYDKSVETVREGLKLEPQNPEGQVILGWSLVLSGKLDEGFDSLRGAIKNDPANVFFNRLYGSLLTQFGRNEQAITLYKDLLERFPNNEELAEAAHSGLSVAYVNVGDYAKGEAELEVLFQRNPEDPGVNNDLGYLYADQGKNLEQAESMIRKALQGRPNEGAYLDSLGWVLYKRNKFQEAVEPLERAVKQLSGGGDATIYEHLGDVYFRLQENAKAKEAWEHAEQSAKKAIPSDKRLTEIRKKLESLGKLAPTPKPASGDTP
ncbi:tetratricopeptide repeat protein [Singulisphaera rosea]